MYPASSGYSAAVTTNMANASGFLLSRVLLFPWSGGNYVDGDHQSPESIHTSFIIPLYPECNFFFSYT